MIGRLFATPPFTSPKSGTPIQQPTEKNRDSVSASTTSSRFTLGPSLHDDQTPLRPSSRTSDPYLKPPVSFIDDADTKNLLYGATNLSATSLADIDSLKDIRIVIITDVPHITYPLYDSHCDQTSSTGHKPQTDLPYSAEIPSFQALQERVFGSSQIKYQGPITKLHPFPLNSRSLNSSSSILQVKQKWLISRLFRLELQVSCCTTTDTAICDHPNPHTANHEFHKRSAPFHWEESTTKDPAEANTPSEDLLLTGGLTGPLSVPTTWRPTPSYKQAKNSIDADSPLLAKVADYTCAICVFITAGSDSPSCITNYWEELSASILQLQQSVADRLLISLPSTYRGFKQSRPSIPDATQPRLYSRNQYAQSPSYCLNNDDKIKGAVDVFKQRFLNAVRIPRVICGQERWPELMKELRWGYSYFDGKSQSSKLFLPNVIATFIKCNVELLSIDRRSVRSTALGSLPTRTVIVGDRISTRRLIFILSMLIHDSYSQIFKSYNGSLDFDYHDKTLSHTPVRSASTSSLNTSANFPVQGGVGWEIPKSGEGQVAESPSICTMSHVVRPSFYSSSSNSMSSGSSSLAVASRLSAAVAPPHSSSLSNYSVATNTIRKGASAAINSFSPSFVSLSFLHALLGNELTNSSTPVDDFRFSPSLPPVPSVPDDNALSMECENFLDFFPQHASYTTKSPTTYNLTVPKLPLTGGGRFERTATTLASPHFKDSAINATLPLAMNGGRRNSSGSRISSRSLSSSALSLLMDHTPSTTPSTLASSVFPSSYENVSYLSKNAVCLDVPALEDDEDENNTFLTSFMQTPPAAAADVVVLPPIAGHNSEFHPDFTLQACPMTRDLDERIVSAMKLDGIGTQTLIINAESMEIFVLDVNDIGSEQVVVSKTKTMVTDREVEIVDTELSAILRTSDVTALKQIFDARFHL